MISKPLRYRTFKTKRPYAIASFCRNRACSRHVVVEPKSRTIQLHVFSSLDSNITQEMALVRCNSNPGHPRDHRFGTLMQIAASNTRPVLARHFAHALQDGQHTVASPSPSFLSVRFGISTPLSFVKAASSGPPLAMKSLSFLFSSRSRVASALRFAPSGTVEVDAALGSVETGASEGAAGFLPFLPLPLPLSLPLLAARLLLLMLVAVVGLVEAIVVVVWWWRESLAG